MYNMSVAGVRVVEFGFKSLTEAELSLLLQRALCYITVLGGSA